MPFINDRIQANRESIARSSYENNLPRHSRFRFDPQQVVELLRSRIVGQDAAIAAMDDMLHTVKADISSEHRPLAVNMFIGPTGSGKTESVKIIAEAIHGSSDKLCRIDMNTLAQEHYTAALTGAPPGYVGSKEGQTLFDEELIKGSFSKPGIVLFDELEKASQEVMRALLNVLDTGRLLLTAGSKEIDFRNALIFFTSNIGAAEVAAYRRQFQQGWRHWLGVTPNREADVIDDVLHQRFDPEFLNRIDRIETFQRLDKQWLPALFDIEIKKLLSRLQKVGVSLRVDVSVREHFCRHMDERFGARDLNRQILTELQPLIARRMLEYPESQTFIARCESNRLLVAPLLS